MLFYITSMITHCAKRSGRNGLLMQSIGWDFHQDIVWNKVTGGVPRAGSCHPLRSILPQCRKTTALSSFSGSRLGA